MIETECFAKVEVRSALELRGWLAANHTQPDSVWLVTFKKNAGSVYLSRLAVLDELLCFGWIDGIRRALDQDRTMQLIAPRRTDAWTKSYRDLVADLEHNGQMEAPGRAAIARAKKLGLWMANPEIDALVIPEDLAAALQSRPPAHHRFTAFAPSHRRNVLRWIAGAKQPATRATRIEQTVSLAFEGKKVPQF